MSELTMEPEVSEFSQLIILDRTGDTRIQWSKTDADQVTAARKRFLEFQAKGYAAYSVSKSGKQGEVLHEFDPTAERVILCPPVIGG